MFTSKHEKIDKSDLFGFAGSYEQAGDKRLYERLSVVTDAGSTVKNNRHTYS